MTTEQRIEALQAENERLREALEKIVSKDYDRRNPWHAVLQIARGALADQEQHDG